MIWFSFSFLLMFGFILIFLFYLLTFLFFFICLGWLNWFLLFNLFNSLAHLFYIQLLNNLWFLRLLLNFRNVLGLFSLNCFYLDFFCRLNRNRHRINIWSWDWSWHWSRNWMRCWSRSWSRWRWWINFWKQTLHHSNREWSRCIKILSSLISSDIYHFWP